MLANEFISFCKQYLGRPYIWGGSGPDVFDCSGYVQVVLARIGLDPPGDQTANDLYRYFTDPRKGVAVATPKCGCLVFYGKPSKIGHVAICIDDTNMIEAGGGGSETISIDIARKQKAEVRVRPIDRRPDIVSIIQPLNLPWS